MVQTTAVVLMLRYSKQNVSTTDIPYLSTTAVVMSELFKVRY